MNTGPKKTTYEAEEIADVIQRASAEIEARGLTKAAAARDADIGNATLSEFLAGKYKGDKSAVARKVEDWLGSLADRADAEEMLAAAPEFQATKTAEQFHAALAFAHHAGRMVVLAGGPGVGKTTTCNWYAQNNPNVWEVYAEPSVSTAHGILAEIAAGMRLPVVGHGARHLRSAIIERMSDGRRGLLIIDEAQQLNQQGLEQVRALHDRCKVGLALVGNQEVYARIGGPSRSTAFAQIHSRVAKAVQRSKPFAADVEALAAAWGVETPAEVKFLKDIAKKPGALRGMTNCMQLATMMASGTGERRNIRHLRAAWADLASDAPIQVAA